MADNVLHSVSALYNFFSLKNCKSFKFEPEMLFQKKTWRNFNSCSLKLKLLLKGPSLKCQQTKLVYGYVSNRPKETSKLLHQNTVVSFLKIK